MGGVAPRIHGRYILYRGALQGCLRRRWRWCKPQRSYLQGHRVCPAAVQRKVPSSSVTWQQATGPSLETGRSRRVSTFNDKHSECTRTLRTFQSSRPPLAVFTDAFNFLGRGNSNYYVNAAYSSLGNTTYALRRRLRSWVLSITEEPRAQTRRAGLFICCCRLQKGCRARLKVDDNTVVVRLCCTVGSAMRR